MPIRRLNYTKRKKLTRDQVRVSLAPASEGLPRSFNVELSLPNDLPGNARVFVEAYRTSPAARMRFDFGTVDAIRYPRPDQCRLTEFDEDLPPLFRVKVTDSGESAGRLLADAQRIQPVVPDEDAYRRRGILYIAWQDNGGVVWDLDLADQRGPVLYVDETADPHHELPGRIEFQALVYPEVIRRVLSHILSPEERHSLDDPESWACIWASFPKRAFGFTEPLPEDDVDPEDWIRNAVRWCARQAGFVSKMMPMEENE